MVRSTSPIVQGHIANFTQLIKVLELIMKSSRCSVDPSELQQCISSHLRGFALLYGEYVMTIKFHQTMHLPKYLRKYGFLLNCFVHERKHRMPKRFANHVTNTTGNWEHNVLREVTCNHLAALREDNNRFNTTAALIQPRRPTRQVASMLIEAFGQGDFQQACSARTFSYEKFYRGDVVHYNQNGTIGAGRVDFLASMTSAGDEVVFVGLTKFESIANTRRVQKWVNTAASQVCFLADIIGAVTWCTTGHDEILTITPLSRV